MGLEIYDCIGAGDLCGEEQSAEMPVHLPACRQGLKILPQPGQHMHTWCLL